MALVEDGALLGSRQLDMGNSGLELAKKQEEDAIVNLYLFLTEGPVFLLGMEVNELQNELPASTHQILKEHGCFEDEEN